MSKKWKSYKSGTRPNIDDGKERVFLMDVIKKEEMEKEEMGKPKKISFYTKMRDNGVIHFFGIIALFGIVALSLSFYQISYDEKDQVIIKLGYVDNYTNIVKDECGTIYTPVNPRLTTSVRVEEKEKDTSAPAILLNTSDIYEVTIMSSPAIRGGMFFQEITGFKLADSSKYIKNC